MDEVTAPQRPSVFVARQPILDQNRRVFGYELLYRDSPEATMCAASGDFAAARVITDALITIGLDSLTAGRQAFINFTRAMLVGGAATLLPRDRVVIELREDIAVDNEVMETCRKLRDAGWMLALDDFVVDSDAELLIPYVRYVKVDVLATTPEVQTALAARLRPRGIDLVAEKVETGDVFAATSAAGYRLFQGHFFCRPHTVGATTISASQIAYIRLLAALGRADLSVQELESLVKHDVSLTYRVLRCVNATTSALRREVHSIGQALVLTGFDPIRRWVALWCLAGLDPHGSPELARTCLLRARCCELLAIECGQSTSAPEVFIVGLCSLLDDMLARPMTDLVPELPLSREATDALLGTPNWIRAVLDATIAYEHGAWEVASTVAAALGLGAVDVSIAYGRAMEWADDFVRPTAAHYGNADADAAGQAAASPLPTPLA